MVKQPLEYVTVRRGGHAVELGGYNVGNSAEQNGTGRAAHVGRKDDAMRGDSLPGPMLRILSRVRTAFALLPGELHPGAPELPKDPAKPYGATAPGVEAGAPHSARQTLKPE
jgi:hypothetical protein